MVGCVLIMLGADGLLSVQPFLPAEIAPKGSRSVSKAAMESISGITDIGVALLYPPIQNLIGSYAILPMIVLSLATLATLGVLLPETKGRQVYDIVDHLYSGTHPIQNEAHPLNGNDKNSLYGATVDSN